MSRLNEKCKQNSFEEKKYCLFTTKGCIGLSFIKQLSFSNVYFVLKSLLRKFSHHDSNDTYKKGGKK